MHPRTHSLNRFFQVKPHKVYSCVPSCNLYCHLDNPCLALLLPVSPAKVFWNTSATETTESNKPWLCLLQLSSHSVSYIIFAMSWHETICKIHMTCATFDLQCLYFGITIPFICICLFLHPHPRQSMHGPAVPAHALEKVDSFSKLPWCWKYLGPPPHRVGHWILYRELLLWWFFVQQRWVGLTCHTDGTYSIVVKLQHIWSVCL